MSIVICAKHEPCAHAKEKIERTIALMIRCIKTKKGKQGAVRNSIVFGDADSGKGFVPLCANFAEHVLGESSRI